MTTIPTGQAQRSIWEPYLTNYDEGLGLVYERFVLNDFLDDLRQRANIQTVLEAPIYGMAGVSGINSVALAEAGCQVTLVDDTPDRAEQVQRIWSELDLVPTLKPFRPTSGVRCPSPTAVLI